MKGGTLKKNTMRNKKWSNKAESMAKKGHCSESQESSRIRLKSTYGLDMSNISWKD